MTAFAHGEGKFGTYHLALERLWHKLLEVLCMPLYGRLLRVHVWSADGWPNKLD